MKLSEKMPNIWKVRPLWDGATVVIIGGGPSVTAEQVEYVHNSGHKVIAINDAYRLAPWADLLYGCDAKWWEWHEGVPDFKGIKVCLRYCVAGNGCEGKWTEDLYPDIKSLAYDGIEGISTIPGLVKSGKDSGYQAIQLAIQLGAEKIVLLGYDMKSESVDLSRKDTMDVLDLVLGEDYPVMKKEAVAAAMRDIQTPHWHGHHPDGVPPPFDLMIKQYETMVRYIDWLGVEIINCSPGTALHSFWENPLEDTI